MPKTPAYLNPMKSVTRQLVESSVRGSIADQAKKIMAQAVEAATNQIIGLWSESLHAGGHKLETLSNKQFDGSATFLLTLQDGKQFIVVGATKDYSQLQLWLAVENGIAYYVNKAPIIKDPSQLAAVASRTQKTSQEYGPIASKFGNVASLAQA